MQYDDDDQLKCVGPLCVPPNFKARNAHAQVPRRVPSPAVLPASRRAAVERIPGHLHQLLPCLAVSHMTCRKRSHRCVGVPQAPCFFFFFVSPERLTLVKISLTCLDALPLLQASARESVDLLDSLTTHWNVFCARAPVCVCVCVCVC